jgi:hypothetical protein
MTISARSFHVDIQTKVDIVTNTITIVDFGDVTAIFQPGSLFDIINPLTNITLKNCTNLSVLSSTYDPVNLITKVVTNQSLAGSGIDQSIYPLPILNPNVDVIVSGYYIDFTDTSRAPLIAPKNEINNQTCLSLPGRGALNYGEVLNKNFLHMLEHYANSTPPMNPIAGQLWFNTSNDTMSVYSNEGAWIIIAVGGSGSITVAQADAKYVQLTGSTMTGSLTMTLDTGVTIPTPTGGFVNDSDVVNKLYVDNTASSQHITLSGDVVGSGTGTIITSLNSSGVVSGTYSKVTVNNKGLVTTGSNINSSDVIAAIGSQTANYFFAAPSGSSGTPTFRAITAADIPTLNQNTTGSAGSTTNIMGGDSFNIVYQTSAGVTGFIPAPPMSDLFTCLTWNGATDPTPLTWKHPQSNSPISLISTNITAVAGITYVATASVALSLPSAPVTGDIVRFVNLSGTLTCTIIPYGTCRIMGVSGSMTVDVSNASFGLQYSGNTTNPGWVLI